MSSFIAPYTGVHLLAKERSGAGQTTCSHTIGDRAVTGICRDEQLSTVFCLENVWERKVSEIYERFWQKGKQKRAKREE